MNNQQLGNDIFDAKLSTSENNKNSNKENSYNSGCKETMNFILLLRSSLDDIKNLNFSSLKMNWSEYSNSIRNSRELVLLVVFIALFFDNMLLTTVGKIENYLKLFCFVQYEDLIFFFCFRIVPIIPEYLLEIDINSTIAPSQTATTSAANVAFSNLTITTTAVPAAVSEADNKWKKVQMNRLNTKVGLMFASKPIVQLIANPFIGPLTNRIGYSIPMFIGFAVMFISTLSK
jgi:MFS transporter, DHA1 family, solute carrier family 18 (vesicular amine transporter), member 1/2